MRLARGMSWIAAIPVAVAALFLLAATIGSAIPRNPGWIEPDDGIPVMIESNGVHTGIVMPVATQDHDWRPVFPSAGEPTATGELPTHVAIGWGEKEVFLETPTWSDLRFSTVMRIALRGGDGLMRVGHYVRPAASENHRWIRLRPEEYRRLTDRIEASLPPLTKGEARRSYDSYEIGARNYDALGRYTLANTCNQWVGDVLAHAGIRMGAWTPLAGGVMRWIPVRTRMQAGRTDPPPPLPAS